MKVHPVAEMFPMMEGEEYEEFKADVKEHGLREPLTVYKGVLLDGRNRLKAAEELGVPYETWEFPGTDEEVVPFIISLNLNRRHLSGGQRGMVAAGIADWYAQQITKGRPSKGAPNGAPSGRATGQAAQKVGAATRTTQRAKRVKTEAPDLAKQVTAGLMTLEAAEKEVKRRKGPSTVPMKLTAKPTFNQTNDLVSWAKWTWNPVTGCEHGCTYCYAREIAEKFQARGIPQYASGFAPAFHANQLLAPDGTKMPKSADPEDARWHNVFVCSMADLFGKWVPQEWIDQVLDVERQTPQWTYLHLSKFPSRLASIDWPSNTWVGTTVDTQRRVKIAEEAFRKIKGTNVKWLSCEPLLEPLKFSTLEMFDLVVIGASTKVQATADYPTSEAFAPPIEWVADLIAQARAAGCKVYCKENLQGKVDDWVYPGMTLPQELP